MADSRKEGKDEIAGEEEATEVCWWMGEAKLLAREEVDEAEVVMAGTGYGDAAAERVEGGRGGRVCIGEGETKAQVAAEGEVEQGSGSGGEEEVRGLGGEAGRRRREEIPVGGAEGEEIVEGGQPTRDLGDELR